MKKHLAFLCFVLLGLITFLPSQGQTNSIELKDGSGTLISAHKSITEAVAAIPSTISQAYIIEITATYTGGNETYPISFAARSGASNVNTITLRPAMGVTSASISTSYSATADGLIYLDDADYVIIDGRAGGVGNARNLTIANTNTSSTATIMFKNGATFNTVRYCNLTHASSSSAGRCIAFSTSASNPTGNSDNLIEHTKMTGGRYVINFSGTTTNPNTRNKIYGCDVINMTYAGIYSTSSTGMLEVDSNSFYTTSATGGGTYVMYLSSQLDTLKVTRNRIYSIRNSSTTTSTYGIYVSPGTTGIIPVYIVNNFVSLDVPGSTGLHGIYLLGSGTGDFHVYYNTVRISGSLSTGGSANSVISSAFYKSNSDAASTFDVKNNIFVNERTGGSANTQHVGLYVSNTSGTFDFDYNTYYVASGMISRWGTAVNTTLTDHQNVFPTVNEQNSNIKQVNFVSVDDLHLAGASLGDEDLKATVITSVTNDIDNNPRKTLTYRGADDDPANPLPAIKNDVGVVSIDLPGGSCSSSIDVKATIQNFGVNQVDTFTVNWSVDGVLQSPVEYHLVLDTVLGSGSTTAQVTLGSIPVAAGTAYAIKTWTSKPNNLNDPNKSNDSLKAVYRMALAAGTYTIGGTAPDFATISEVVNNLNAYGICGPVVFDIRSGTYTGNFSIGQIPGASATNTITFQSEAKDSTAVILSYAASASALDNYTIELKETDYITLRYLTIERSGTGTNSTVISIPGMSDDIKIYSNIIRGPANTATDANGVRSNIFGALTAVTNNIEIYNNRLENNSNGVWLNTSITQYSSGAKVYNNIVTSNYTAIFLAGQHNPQIYKNNITRYDQTATTDFYGISLNLIDSSLLVYQNKVETNRGYGIRLRDCYGYAGNEGRIINNMITMNFASTSTINYGLVIDVRDEDLLFAHNTVQMNTDYTSTTANNGARALYTPTTTANAFKNIRIVNNIFYSAMDGVAVYTNTNFLKGVTEMDYNLYYSGDANLSYVSTYQPDLDAHKTASGKDEHSKVIPVVFAAANDAHLVFMQDFMFGKTGLNVTEDFDGDMRCVSLPTVGADEYAITFSLPVATFIGPNDASTGDRVYFLFNGNLSQTAIYKWYVNGTFVSEGINFVYTFPSAGNYEIMQIAENCAGTDSLTKNYVIADPTVEPVINFAADRNQVYQNELVYFTDLSQNGPTSWVWSVTPNNGSVIISDSTAQDPFMIFTEPGKYEICLKAENAIGAGTPRCRTAYIEVYPLVDMCTYPVTNFERGKIFDDGGESGVYKANMDCYFFINPCASEVNLKFTQWTSTDADDKLTIYDGDTSDPANIIAVIAGGMTNPGGTTGFTAKSGKMWLKWKTDASLQYDGFAAEWTSTPATINPTVASFTVPDTLFTNAPVNFTNTSSGSGLLFFWDFDYPNYQPSDNNSYTTVNPVKTYPFPGTYTVLLESTNCLGKDSLLKQVIVVDPTTAPVPDFEARLTKLSIGEENQLIDKSNQGPTSWKWEITPSAGVLFVDPATSKNPRVIFNFGGIYDVKLTVTNSIGTDSVVKTSYIEVLEYCMPNVSKTNTDVTIRRVVFGGLDQSSDYGVNKYNDFSLTGKVAEVSEGGTHAISIERNTNNERVNFAVWMDFNQDGDFDDANERVLFDSASLDQILNTTVTIPAGIMLGETRMRVAVARANLTTQPCGPVVVGEYEDYKVRITVDDEPPIITIKGNNPEYVEVGYGYHDSGAIAIDNVDGNLTFMIMTSGSVDTLTVGTYTITYKVTDARGNSDSATRTVYVTADATAPVIMLNGNDTVTINVYDMYMEDGATAIDNPFGTNLSDSIIITGTIDTAKVGTYVLTYTVKDSIGNTASTTRVIIVQDTVAPVIVLNGNAVIDHDVNIPYIDAGATVTDNYYNGLTYTVSGTVNVNKLGTYVLTFNAVDSSGNMAMPVTRTINVIDRVAPTITLVGSDVVYLARWQDYTDSGYTLSDNYYDSSGITVDTLGTWTNASVEGLYYIQYRATDSSGNTSLSAKRVIYVNGYNSVKETMQGETNVYPNPSNGRFTVETSLPFAEGTVISVTNILGARVYEAYAVAGDNKVQINLEGTSPGMYFVNITTGSATQTTKIVIR